MKKRLISILLTVLMVMSMFTGMSVSAYADDAIDSKYYKEYTLVSGDYVLRICQRNGINYYTCKEAIMALNNITSENGFRYLGVGETVRIPVSDAAAVAIMTGAAVGSTGSTGSSTTTGTSGVDSVAYYLMPYTMQRGETVLGVCNSLGINFTKNEDLIQSVNGIKAWTGVKAGDTVLLPSSKTPAVGTTCYAVTAHKIASGETTYNICQNKGINYNSNAKLMQALNPKTNFSNIKAGATMYLPIVTTIKPASTNTNTGSTNNGNTNTDNTTDKNNTTTTTAKTYDINANINTTYGSMKFYVNNKQVSTAAEGAVVTVDVITKDNKAVESLVVKYDDGRADVKLEANTFIMPNCDVRVDAEINAGYDITINSNYSFKTVAQVGGINVSSASEGSSVKIVSTDPSYAIKEVVAYYSTFWGINKTVLTVNEQNCFTMPKKDVTVDVILAPVETYSFFRGDAINGSFDIQVDGSSVSKAAKGAKVTILWQPMTGYEISSINVYKSDKAGTKGDPISIYNNSFTMPGCPVYVEVFFDSSENAIDIEAIEGGVLYATAGKRDAAHISEQETGYPVYVYGTATMDGYDSDIKELVVTRKADGHRVSATAHSSGYYEFAMPAGGVIISGKLESAERKVELAFNGTGSENRVTVRAADYDNWVVLDNSTNTSNNYVVGTKLSFSTLARDAHSFSKFEVYVNGSSNLDQELTNELNSTGSITMPDANIKVKAYFTAEYISIPPAKLVGNAVNNAVVSYQVASDGANFKSDVKCKIGDWVKVIVVSNNGMFKVDENSVTVVDRATGSTMALTLHDGSYCFKMPAESVDITVSLGGAKHELTLKTVDATTVNPKNLQGQNLWGMYIATPTPDDKIYENSQSANGTKVDVVSGNPIIIFFDSSLTDKYTVDKVEMTSTEKGTVHEGGLTYDHGNYRFFMADEDITVTVYVKEKANKTHSLLDLSYPSDKMTVGCTVGAMNNSVVTTANEGEVVYVKAQTKNAAEYKLLEDGISITKKSNDNVGRGSFVKGAANVPNSDMMENTYYPAVDSNGNVVGWKYIMPAGGVNVSVSCKAVEYDVTLIVKDTNGKTADANGTNLNALGYVVISTTEADVSTARQVTNGIANDISFKSAVHVSLSEVGASLYNIKSVTVSGVEVSNNGFWMPAKNAELTVTLEEKNPAPTVVSFKTDSAVRNGTVQYYKDEACTQLITDGKADVGMPVYAKFTANTGYKLKAAPVVKNDTDKEAIAVVEKTAVGGDPVYGFNAPANNVTLFAEFELQSYTLKIVLDNTIFNDAVKVKVGNTENTIKSNDTITVPYNSDVRFWIVDTNKYELVSATASVSSVSISNSSFKMPASDLTLTLDLNSK